LQHIAKGGFGSGVSCPSKDVPVRRRVALKIIKLGIYSYKSRRAFSFSAMSVNPRR